jgi:hypothetical protein
VRRDTTKSARLWKHAISQRGRRAFEPHNHKLARHPRGSGTFQIGTRHLPNSSAITKKRKAGGRLSKRSGG